MLYCLFRYFRLHIRLLVGYNVHVHALIVKWVYHVKINKSWLRHWWLALTSKRDQKLQFPYRFLTRIMSVIHVFRNQGHFYLKYLMSTRRIILCGQNKIITKIPILSMTRLCRNRLVWVSRCRLWLIWKH